MTEREQQLQGLVAEWSKLAKEWDDEDRKKFDGPAFLYTRSIRVSVLMNCTDAIAALAASPAPAEYPKVCELCEEEINNRNELDWHGIGNCVPICERCNGSGIEPASPAPQPAMDESCSLCGADDRPTKLYDGQWMCVRCRKNRLIPAPQPQPEWDAEADEELQLAWNGWNQLASTAHQADKSLWPIIEATSHVLYRMTKLAAGPRRQKPITGEMPLCGNHAEWWFCERNHLPNPNDECVVCAFLNHPIIGSDTFWNMIVDILKTKPRAEWPDLIDKEHHKSIAAIRLWTVEQCCKAICRACESGHSLQGPEDAGTHWQHVCINHNTEKPEFISKCGAALIREAYRLGKIAAQ